MSEQEPEVDAAAELAERIRGLESVFGLSDEMHLHGVIPFFVGLENGGTPDAITFSGFNQDGKLHVSCELVGNPAQPANRDGQYELAVCFPEADSWALNLMLKLCHYTLETPLNHGETMDIGPAVPKGSPISALAFRKIGSYTAFGKPASVICCIGITKRELKFARQHGAEALFALMPDRFILTSSDRSEFVTKPRFSWLGR